MHAIALVIGDDVEGQLDYFYEGVQVDPYLIKTKEEITQEGKNRLEYFREEYKGQKLEKNEKYSHHFVNFINHILPKTESWTDEEIYQWYVNEYYDIDDIGEDGGEYSTNNPDGFWDYYTIGGRFAGALYLKEGVEYFSTEEHLEYPNYTEDELEELKKDRRADCCRLDELDIERLREDYEKEGVHSLLHYVAAIVKNYELVEFTNPIDYLQELLKSPENGDLRVTVIDYHF